MPSAFDPQPNSAPIDDGPKTVQEMAIAIDKHYDGFMWEGMPTELALSIEEQRRNAHTQLVTGAISAGNFTRRR